MKFGLKQEPLLWRILRSLQLAVMVIVLLAVALAAGTILESAYDVKTARYFVYQSLWFHTILFVLGLNILVVAMSRWPWKKSHAAFLLAHAGILLVLLGGWVTGRWGVDGSMMIQEGEVKNRVELDEHVLMIQRGGETRSILVPWQPPTAEWKQVELPEFDLVVDRYLSHSDPLIQFKSVPANEKTGEPLGDAIQLKLRAQAIGVRREVFLWTGDSSWSTLSLGPARFVILPQDPLRAEPIRAMLEGQPRLELQPDGKGGLKYWAYSSKGQTAQGHRSAKEVQGTVIRPGWMGMEITLDQWAPHAKNATTYIPSRVQYGMDAPPPAVHVKVGKGGEGSELWLGMGDRAVLDVLGQEITLAFVSRSVPLDFGIQLDRFQIDHYTGTQSPAEYSSKVSVVDLQNKNPSESVLISMNEPLERGGFTFYQSSYLPDTPRPTVSIFSVNRDPGRGMKYFGSLLIVAGSILLFTRIYMRKLKARKTMAQDVPADVKDLRI